MAKIGHPFLTGPDGLLKCLALSKGEC